MKYLVALGFLGMASAFQPESRNALKAAVDACLLGTSGTGAECYACDNGQIVASDAVCGDGNTPSFISDWDTSQVDSMYRIFFNRVNFNTDISGWDVSSVTTFEEMFRIASAFDQDLSCWDISEATNFNQMFRQAPMSHTLCWDTGISDSDLYATTDSNPDTNTNCNQDCDAGGAGGDGDPCNPPPTDPAQYIDAQCCNCA